MRDVGVRQADRPICKGGGRSCSGSQHNPRTSCKGSGVAGTETVGC